MSFLPGAPPNLVAGTAEYAKWYVCKDGHLLVFAKQRGATHAPRVGSNGTLGANVGWRGRGFWHCRLWEKGKPKCQQKCCAYFAWAKEDDKGEDLQPPPDVVVLNGKWFKEGSKRHKAEMNKVLKGTPDGAKPKKRPRITHPAFESSSSSGNVLGGSPSGKSRLLDVLNGGDDSDSAMYSPGASSSSSATATTPTTTTTSTQLPAMRPSDHSFEMSDLHPTIQIDDDSQDIELNPDEAMIISDDEDHTQ